MKLKKIIIVSILLILTISNKVIFADDENEELDYDFVYEDIIDVASDNTKEPNILSRNAIILDRESNVVIWGKQENLKVAQASTTNVVAT